MSAKGNGVSANGNGVSAKGNGVSTKGNAVSAKGNAVSVKGNRLTQGNTVSAKVAADCFLFKKLHPDVFRIYSRNANLLWGAWLVASFFGTCSKQGPEPFTPLRRNQFRKNHGFRHRASHDLPKDTGWRSFLYCV